jgi:hypothetical protein
LDERLHCEVGDDVHALVVRVDLDELDKLPQMNEGQHGERWTDLVVGLEAGKNSTALVKVG